MKVQLREVAIARSGDKGDTANIGVIGMTNDVYKALKKQLTAEDVKEYFSSVCAGPVERFELPNLKALNFLLHESLGGGGTVSLMLDAQGKTFGAAILGMEIDLPEEQVREASAVLSRGVSGGRT